MDDGSTQAWSYDSNEQGSRTFASGPLGRTTLYVYEANGVDLKEVRQVVAGGAQELVQSFTYNAQHLPLTITDAAGQTMTYTYNPAGQVLTVTTPERAGITEDRITEYTYDPDGYLMTVASPFAGASMSYTYDGYGRRRTMTDASGYPLTFDYDALDRITRITFPDGSYDETVYERLDAASHRDRMGRWTHAMYDPLRRQSSATDAEGRTVVINEWLSCSTACGNSGERLSKLTDANGNSTIWEYDLQGRVVRERRADQTTYEYTYEATTSRLASVEDPKGNVKTYSYDLADALVGITYAEAAGTAPTPDVTFAYDASRNRLAGFTDGSGTTTYGYHPVTSPPSLGAEKLATIDGPLANDTIAYGYDELGRVVSRSINGAANLQTILYGENGQPASITNLLGTFTYRYDPVSGQPTGILYPNGQSASYAYYDVNADRRLREIHNRYPGGATLSRFEYTYDRAANVKTWLQQSDSNPPVQYEYGYDATDQLLAAILRTTDPTPQVLKRYYYAYDPVGNRKAEQVDDTVRSWTHNAMNQLVTEQAGGALLFRGSTDEPAVVTVGGAPASTAADNTFSGAAEVPAGTSQVTVTARDFALPPNLRTNTYEVTQTGATKTFTFDANGNMTSDGTRTFEWDAENRLTAIVEGNQRTEFDYDALGRRIARTERQGGAAQERARYIHCNFSTCEKRNESGSAVLRAIFRYGELAGATPSFSAEDHLTSIRETVESGPTLAGRWDYEPFGRSEQVVGNSVVLRDFTGHERVGEHPFLGALYRAYDPGLGTWLSEDRVVPGTSRSGYAYVSNSPISFLDPDGAMRRRVPGWVKKCLKKAAHMGLTGHHVEAPLSCGIEHYRCRVEGELDCECGAPPGRMGSDPVYGFPTNDKFERPRKRCMRKVWGCCMSNWVECTAVSILTIGLVHPQGDDCTPKSGRCEDMP